MLFGAIAFASDNSYVPEMSYDEDHIAHGPPAPNNNDDDDDDDEYYYDDSNFGGRQRMGKSKGNTPRNNQAQNKQFKDATKGLTKDQKRQVHDAISKKGLGYQGVKDYVNSTK